MDDSEDVIIKQLIRQLWNEIKGAFSGYTLEIIGGSISIQSKRNGTVCAIWYNRREDKIVVDTMRSMIKCNMYTEDDMLILQCALIASIRAHIRNKDIQPPRKLGRYIVNEQLSLQSLSLTKVKGGHYARVI